MRIKYLITNAILIVLLFVFLAVIMQLFTKPTGKNIERDYRWKNKTIKLIK